MRVREIKIEAKERFAVNRYHAMLIYGVVYALALNISVMSVLLWLANKWAIGYGALLIAVFLLMLAPFSFGMAGYYLKLYKFESGNPTIVLEGFSRNNIWRVIVLSLLRFALWLAFTILLIVPGIIFALRTSMATYILRANPKLRPVDALKASSRVMKSHCIHYFTLMLSFVGWILLGLVTFGIGLIWVLPYENLSKAVFYKRELQGDKTAYRKPGIQKPVEARKPDIAQPEPKREEKERSLFSDEKIEVETLDEVSEITEEQKRKLGIGDFTPPREMTPDEREREDRFFYGSEKIVVEEYDESDEQLLQPDEEITEQPQSDEEITEQPQPETVEAEVLTEITEVSEEPDGTIEKADSVPVEPSPQNIETEPLPDESVVMTEDGSRVVAEPMTGKTLSDGEDKSVEINERGESIQQRLMRLRAEREARMGQKGNTPTKKNNVEIGED